MIHGNALAREPEPAEPLPSDPVSEPSEPVIDPAEPLPPDPHGPPIADADGAAAIVAAIVTTPIDNIADMECFLRTCSPSDHFDSRSDHRHSDPRPQKQTIWTVLRE
ncbi:hypothetical protein rerp_36530 [Rhodococcus erythropolis]|nr:hypothetical protein rerp_36530 [Rhodococcus erythropolis]